MARSFERKVTNQGLTLKLYRGEGVALLAFDLDHTVISDEFVGFSVEVKYPGAKPGDFFSLTAACFAPATTRRS